MTLDQYNVDEAQTGARRLLQQYRLFGLRLASDFNFANPLYLAGDTPAKEPDCVFVFDKTAKIDIDTRALDKAREKIIPRENSGNGFSLYRLEQCDLLRLRGLDFFVFERLIDAYLHDDRQSHMVEIALLGTVLAFWLERAGIAALHASAVLIDDTAVAFLAHNTGGKTTLAASFVQAGFPLISDDIVPVERRQDVCLARSAYPSMRMWPEQADYFVGSHEDYEFVHPQLAKRRIPLAGSGLGEFHAGVRPLKRLYLPVRGAGQRAVRIEPLAPGEALIELIRHSFIAGIVAKLGWQPRRLGFLKHLVQQASVRRLLYPDGYGHLPAVREAILRDLASG